ncbi:bifunctional oligoribonuclease/PAP phosphatase NrnA [Candidatus Peregrinibacteria bacterium]|nr:bifunctional oligoribonuclease/PAP phosphatase NrnA [Candidatus Peregrinibacteria bacterium]
MAKETLQQIIDFLKDKKKILLMGHMRIDADALSSVLTMYMILKGLGKEVTAVCSDPVPDVFRFLPTTDVLRNSLGGPDFIITLDCTKTPLDKLKYNLEGNKVNIVLTPKSGVFNEKDISFNYSKAGTFDAIMVFDCGDLEQLGKLYENNVEMFYDTPVVNIDHHASNTQFGVLNLVSPVAASTTEILYELIQAMEADVKKKLLTPDIATLLLAGIITDTGSFQNPNTSPKSMEIAAKLLDEGARQQEIIRHIYKTKSLSTLKVWGIVLSKIHVDPIYRMVWSTVSKRDLEEAEATSEEVSGIIDDLLTNAPGAEVVFLVKETEEGYIAVSLRTTTPAADSSKIAGLFGGGGHVQAAGFKIRDGRPLEVISADVIDKIRKFQGERLNIHVNDHGNVVSLPQPKPETRDERRETSPAQASKTTVQSGVPKKVTYLEFNAKPVTRDPSTKLGADERQEASDERRVTSTTPAAKMTLAPSANAPFENGDARHKKRKRKRRHKKNPNGGSNGGPEGGSVVDRMVETKKSAEIPKSVETPKPVTSDPSTKLWADERREVSDERRVTSAVQAPVAATATETIAPPPPAPVAPARPQTPKAEPEIPDWLKQ